MTKMGLPKGTTNNRRGRPKGSQNKVNKELRILVKEFLQMKMGDLDSLFDELQPRDKAKFLTELLSYSMPKYVPIEMKEDLSDDISPINFFQQVNQHYISKYLDKDGEESSEARNF